MDRWTGVITTRYQTGQSRETTAVYDRSIVRAVKKNLKTGVGDITNKLHGAAVKVSLPTVSTGGRPYHKIQPTHCQ